MRGALAVVVVDGDTHRHVTASVRGLRFTRAASGGFTFASMRLRLPRGAFRNLGPADRIIISDARTGRTVWEGFAENPGVIDGPGGQEYDLSAIGTTILAGDSSQALVYVDRDLAPWQEFKSTQSAYSASAQTSDDPTAAEDAADTPGLLCQMNPGQPVGSFKVAVVRYAALETAGMEVGGIAGTVVSGKTDAGYVPDLVSRIGSTASVAELHSGTRQISTTPYPFSVRAGTTELPAGRKRLELRLKRIGGATNVADDDTWSFFRNVQVFAQLLDRYGIARHMLDPMSGGLLRAFDVVDDLIGRVMRFVDAPASTVAFTPARIDQLAYPDGATAQQVLDDLSLWESGHLWEILEHTGNGYRFNYRPWPTAPRYEISAALDGFDAPGGDVDLCNRIAVYWTDHRGRRRSRIVTASVPALDAAGRTRDAEPIELEDGRGSAANAQRIGEQTLAAKNTPPKAGTATVSRWILDRDTGRMVAPWEIETGYMVRVRETGDDLRLTEIEYDDEAAASTLTLGEPVLTEDQRIARLSKPKRRV